MPTSPEDVRQSGQTGSDQYTVKATRMMWWTTPAPDIECVKG